MPASSREQQLAAWLSQVLQQPYVLEPLAGDASFRRYYRARAGRRTWVVMDAPPGREDVRTFCDVAERLRGAGLNAPALLAREVPSGFLLLEDLGDALYLARLDRSNVEDLYGDALRALLRMQQAVPTAGLPCYDRARLLEEMALFPDWYLRVHCSRDPDREQRQRFDAAVEPLLAAALEQPRGFVHRDYHSRNLLVCEQNPGILDFQDAVLGPVTYDLVSLLRDVYRRWPPDLVRRLARGFLSRANACGQLSGVDPATFARWFDLMGVQRHLKVAGIFARLNHRDGKPAYLRDIPLTLRYLREVVPRHPELAELRTLLEELTG